MSFSNSDDEMEMEFLRERYSSYSNRKYEVFLSFRGEDTRASFISHLYNSLQNAGITVFKDDESLRRGNHISPSLQLAIEESQIAVVVFSRNYADSRWCLKELEKIMKCHRTTGQVVVPVFYDVDPSEVRHQTGQFGKAFQNLVNRILIEEEANEKEEKIDLWEKLREVAGISRVVVLNARGEMEIIYEIDLLAENWRKLLREAAGLSRCEDQNYCQELEIANKINRLVKSWKELLCKAAGISRVEFLKYSGEMEIVDKMDLLVKRWRELLCRAATISARAIDCVGAGGIAKMIDQHVKMLRKDLSETTDGIAWLVVLNTNGKLRAIANEIDHRVKHWKEAFGDTTGGILWPVVLSTNRETEIADGIDLRLKLWKALHDYEVSGDISELVILNTRSGQGVANEIDILVNHWKEELSVAASISRPAVLNSYREMKIANKVNHLMKPWRDALHEAAGIAGIVVLNSRNESEVIKNIVENVTQWLDKTELFIADNPVGVESRVEDIVQLLDHKLSNDVVLLGIWGMGGIGKTTIAKAIYNKIGRNFEGKSFLAHIREVWGQDAGQVRLQEQLLFDINKETKPRIHNIELGKNILKERLRHRRVLLVLDDVNKVHQLNALCASREWVGPGSRIIITTRDMHILRGRRVDKMYTMKVMDERESIELFSWHAFKQESPKKEFTELSRKIIAYSGGLPLALEVLGSYLFDMEVTKWKNVLEKLKKIPNDEVQEKLKISYDGLSDDTEKEIFLDIACFFIGMDRGDIIHILNGSRLCAENGVRVLVERSLVTVDYENKLGMHDLLRDMGREIIRSKSPMELEERSRLWFDEDVLDVLSKETGTKATEGLALKLPRTNTKCLSTKAFKNMRKLRLLQLSGVQLAGDFEYLSKDLRWLCWNGCPLTYIPTNFYQGSLVSIELENSKVTLLWKEAQVMEKLKILNLSHSHYLKQTPDFSNLPFLEKLILIDCPKLSEVSYTIGHLNKILLINFQDCVSLRNLPRSIYKLKSLKTLILSGCLKIEKLEEDLEQMESLTILVADKTGITRVPFSLVRSKSIGYISLCGFEGFSRDVFPSIIWSWMSPSNNILSRVETFIGMSSLVSLEVPNGNSHHMSYISKDLPKLQRLWIKSDSEQLSRDATSILDVLCTTNFEEFESTASTSQMPNMNAFTLIKCNSQEQISGSKTSLRSLLIQMGMSCQVTHTLKQSILQNMAAGDGNACLLPSDNYPDWLTFNSEGSSVTFEIPHVNRRNLKKMMCHVHCSSPDNITSDGLKNLLLINHTKSTIQLYKREALASIEADEWQRVLSNNEPGNKVQIIVVFWSRLIVNKTTVYLIYEPMGEKVEHCHVTNKNIIPSSGDDNVFAIRPFSPQVESIYEPMEETIEHCQAPDKNVLISSCDENVCDVMSASLKVESFDDLRCSSIKSSIKRLFNKCLPCKYIRKEKLQKKNQG